MTEIQSVTILGSTGSIGLNTLDVIKNHPDRYRVFALAANNNVQGLLQQCQVYCPAFAVMQDEKAAKLLQEGLKTDDTKVLTGSEGLEFIAGHENVDCVMAAIVGSSGLAPAYAAVNAGKKVLLANKEALVMAGTIFMEAVAKSEAVLLPIDSEHNAMFQCLPINDRALFKNLPVEGFRKIVLTGSGGPFLHSDPGTLGNVTPDQACAHPNWRMGEKISVDSATMVNKALELIEACYLFGLEETAIEIMIHPQSIIHSLVYYQDGSVLAQLGNPDMRTPIAHGLAWPDRIKTDVEELDLAAVSQLNFIHPDVDQFPALKLGRDAAKSRGSAPVILNAANEMAVASFLAGTIRFNQIPVIIDAALQSQSIVETNSLEEVIEQDRKARELVSGLISKLI